jgi:hypothetical protein
MERNRDLIRYSRSALLLFSIESGTAKGSRTLMILTENQACFHLHHSGIIKEAGKPLPITPSFTLREREDIKSFNNST